MYYFFPLRMVHPIIISSVHKPKKRTISNVVFPKKRREGKKSTRLFNVRVKKSRSFSKIDQWYFGTLGWLNNFLFGFILGLKDLLFCAWPWQAGFGYWLDLERGFELEFDFPILHVHVFQR